MEVQDPVAIANGTQGESQDPVHQIERVAPDVEGSVRRIRVE